MSTRTPRSEGLLRTTAYLSVFGLMALGAYVALGDGGSDPKLQQDLDNRVYVSKSRLPILTTAFDEHFRWDRDKAVMDTTQEVLWKDIQDLFPPLTIPGLKRVLRLDYGLKDGRFKLGWTALTLRAVGGKDKYDIPEEILQYVPGTGFSGTDRERWEDDFQDSPWFTWGRYLRDMEVRRHTTSNFEKVQGGATGDPRAETYSWESEIKVMYDQTMGFRAYPVDSIRLVARCIAEPVDTLNRRYYQHRICLFLRYRNNTTFRDLLDNVAHYAPDSTRLRFCMRGSDFGNLCPPSCDEYELPVRALAR
jgi:hypothetical protein